MRNAPKDHSDAYRLLWRVEINGYPLDENPKKHNRPNLAYGGRLSDGLCFMEDEARRLLAEIAEPDLPDSKTR
ncbi:hypothetical protein BH24ACT22_BH24ACT22_10730 [soil metagenome]